jgi:hypothetical protein
MIRTRLAALAAGLLVSGTVMFAAAPAFATSPLPGCGTVAGAPPYTSACLPTVSGGTSAGAVMITLPGVGTLSFNLDNNGIVVPGSASATNIGVNFSHTTPQVSQDGTHVTVTFINPANPVQKYVIKAKVVQTNPAADAANPGFMVTAKATPKSPHHDEQGDNEQGDNEQGEHEDGGKGGGNAPVLQPVAAHQGDHSGGEDGNSQGGGGD